MTGARRGARLALALLAALAGTLALGPATASAEPEEPEPLVLEINPEAGEGYGEVRCEYREGGKKVVEEECEYLEFEEIGQKAVTLKAVPEEGSEFVEFEGGEGSAEACNGKANPCSFTLNDWAAIEVRFEPIEPTLVVDAVGGGEVACIVEGLAEPCEGEEFEFESAISIEAEPGEGWEFAKFQNGTGSASVCNGKPSPCSFSLEKDSTLEAVFVPATRTLTVSKTGSGSGTVTSEPAGVSCGATCTGKFQQGAKVTLSATAASGSTFAGWSGAGCSGTGSCVVVIGEADVAVTATFDLKPVRRKLTVEKKGTGTGTVTSSPAGISCGATCTAEYDTGTEVTLSGTAGPNTEAVKWSGCDSIAAGKCKVTMSAAKTVTATFDLGVRTLTVSKTGSGSGTVTSEPAGVSCGATCAAKFQQGAKVTLSATAASGSTFAGWSGGGCSGTGSCVVVIGEADVAVTATFTANPVAPPPGPEEPKKGTEGTIGAGAAWAGARAKAVGGKARVELSCAGGPCVGTLKLRAKLRRRGRRVVIGRASFSLVDGLSAIVPVRLSAAAKRRLRHRHTLRIEAGGPSVVAGMITLRFG